MAGVELRGNAAGQRGSALNAVLGVAAESVNAMAEVMLMPSLILAFFVAELTPSYVTIGLVPAVAASLWTLARVPATLLVSHRRRQQPWAFGAAAVRAASIAILAVVASATDPGGLSQSGRPLLITFFLCLIVFALAGGFGSVPAASMLRSSVTGAWSGFVWQRAFWSLLLCLVGALVVTRLLGTSALSFPGNYGRLFIAATVCLIAVAAFTVAMREDHSSAHVPPSFSPNLLRWPLRDSRYRRFLLFRGLLSVSAAVDPFLFLYAVTRLGVPVTSIGTYALAAVLGWIVSAPIWIWLERRSSARAVLQSATVLRIIAPALALVLPQLTGTAPLRDRINDNPIRDMLFPIAFAAIGAALAAQSRGNGRYLSALAPDRLQAAYSGLTNGVLVAVAFSSVIGGAIIQRYGYEVLFGAAIAVGLAAVFAGGFLSFIPTQGRDHPRGNQGAHEPGRALAGARSPG